MAAVDFPNVSSPQPWMDGIAIWKIIAYCYPTHLRPLFLSYPGTDSWSRQAQPIIFHFNAGKQVNFITIISGGTIYRWGTIYRAPTGVIVNQNDPMHMVWHDRKGIHLRVREMSRDFVPGKGPC
jgi:hypothetical protein